MRHTLPAPDGYSATLWPTSVDYEVCKGFAGAGPVIGHVRRFRSKLWVGSAKGGPEWNASTGKQAVIWVVEHYEKEIKK